MLVSDEAALRAFLARILGYEHTQAIEHALRSIVAFRPAGGVVNHAAARLWGGQ